MILAHSGVAQDCSHYLNASDGDDANSGTSPSQAVRSMEHAFESFPTGAAVCMTAGEYFHGDDSDGIQLSGSEAANKSMSFILQSFAGRTDIVLSEEEFVVDIGEGKLSFVEGTASVLVLGIGTTNNTSDFPNNTSFLHTLELLSGEIDLTTVTVVLEESVGNPAYERAGTPAPAEAAIIRGAGILSGPLSFDNAGRVVRYVGSGDRVADHELPRQGPLSLEFAHEGGIVTISPPISLDDGTIELTGAGDAVFSEAVTVTTHSSPSVHVTGSGSLSLASLTAEVSDDVTLINVGDGAVVAEAIILEQASEDGHARISNLGTVELGSTDLGTGSIVANLTIANHPAGRLILSPAADESVATTQIINEGEAIFEDAGTVDGDIVNQGSLTIDGEITLTGDFQNADSLTLSSGSTLSLASSFDNTGVAVLNGAVLLLDYVGPFHDEGSILGSENAVIQLNGITALTSDSPLPSIEVLSGSPDLSIERIEGSFTVATAASVSFESLPIVTGNVSVSGTLTVVDSSHVFGDLSLTDGQLIMEGDLIVDGSLHHRGESSLIFEANRLEIGGNLLRESGTFDVGTGSIVFNGSRLQTLEAGTTLDVHNLYVEEANTELLLGPTTVDVHGNLSISDAARLFLGDGRARMVGVGSEAHVDGSVTTSITGNLEFSGPAGSHQRLSGTGLLQNVLIRLDDETDRVTITAEGLHQSGILTLEQGGIEIAPQSRLELTSELTTPAIHRNLGDDNSDGSPDGRGIIANEDGSGTLAAPTSGLNLLFFGRVAAPALAGAELVTGNVRDIALVLESTGTEAGVLKLAHDVAFSGDLSVDASSRIDLNQMTLESIGTSVRHDIDGELSNGTFRMSGTGTIGGDASLDTWLDSLDVQSSGSVDVNALGPIHHIHHESGRLSLSTSGAGMVETYLQEGTDTNFRLSSTVRIGEAFTVRGGSVAIDTYDLILLDGGALISEGDAEWSRSGNGEVVFEANGQIGSASTAIPRIRIDAAPTDTVRLIDDTMVNQSFVHTDGTVSLAGHDLVLDARLWTVERGTYDGAGWIHVTGNVEAAYSTDVSIPRLRVGGADNLFIVRAAMDDPISIRVREAFVMEGGAIELGVNDLVMDGASPTFSYVAGTMEMETASVPEPDLNGEVVLSQSTQIILEQSATIPNIRVEQSSAIQSGSSPLTISGQIMLGSGSLQAPGQSLILADGARIVRSGSGTLSVPPIIEGAVDVHYFTEGRDVGTLESGIELPKVARSLVVDAGRGPSGDVNTIRLTNYVDVTRLFDFRSGNLEINNYPPILNEGAEARFTYGQDPEPRFIGNASYVTRAPITLTYVGWGPAISSSDGTFPASASIDRLTIQLQTDPSGDMPYFRLHGSRRVGSLVIGNESPDMVFDVADKVLAVDSAAQIERGTITGSQEGRIDIGGGLNLDAGSIASGPLTISIGENATIDGTFAAGVLRIAGDLIVTGSLGTANPQLDAESDAYVEGLPSVEFIGNDQLFNVMGTGGDDATTNVRLNRLALQLSPPAGVTSGPSVTMTSSESPFEVGVNELVLENGLIRTGKHTLVLPSNGPGFKRTIASATSHVVGRVRREVRSGQPNPFTQPYGRMDYPLGTDYPTAYYRQAAVVMTEDDPALSTFSLTLTHVGEEAGGLKGFPITGGVDVTLDADPGFYWLVEPSPEMPAAQRFNLELLATGFSHYSGISDARIIRRPAGALSESTWTLHGSPVRYDNALISAQGIPGLFVQSSGTRDPFSEGGTVFTVGLEREMRPYARLQVINAASSQAFASAFVSVDDSVVVNDLKSGKGSGYLRLNPGLRELSVSSSESTAPIVTAEIEVDAGQDLIGVIDTGPSNAGLAWNVLEDARATPQEADETNVLLNVYNGRSEDVRATVSGGSESDTWTDTVKPGSFASEYKSTPPDVLKVDLEAGESTSSIRISLDGLEGQTGLVVLPGPSNSALEPYFITNHGETLKSTVSVEAERPVEIPDRFQVHGNYPNPFNPTTKVSFDLPQSAEVRVEISDMLGRRVMRTEPVTFSPGTGHSLEIDARHLASGTYLYRVVAHSPGNTQTRTGHMVLIK